MRSRLAALIGAGLLALSATSALARMDDQVQAGFNAYAAGRFTEAADAFRVAVASGELPPVDLAVIHNNLGAALSRLGNYDGAIEEYLKAEQLNPDTPNLRRNLVFAYVQRGTARSQVGRRPEAQSDFDQALLLAHDDVTALRGRAELRMATGDLAGAGADLRHALLVQPDDAELASMLAALGGAADQAPPAGAAAPPAAEVQPSAAPAERLPADAAAGSVVVPIVPRIADAAPPPAATTPTKTAAGTPVQAEAPAGAPPAGDTVAAVVPPVQPEPVAAPSMASQVEPDEMAAATPPPAVPGPRIEAEAVAARLPSATTADTALSTTVETAAAPPPASQPEPSGAGENGERFRVVADVSVRAGPGNGFERKGVLSGGEIVVADQRERGWYLVSLDDQEQGWVFRRWLAPVN